MGQLKELRSHVRAGGRAGCACVRIHSRVRVAGVLCQCRLIVGLCVDTCIYMRVDMCVSICVDMFMDMCGGGVLCHSWSYVGGSE